MKKTTKTVKPLRLSTETIRTLVPDQLAEANGAARGVSGGLTCYSCAIGTLC